MAILDDYGFDLPPDRIARFPAERRDLSRLLEVPIQGGPLRDGVFSDLLDRLRPGDLLVLNNTGVLPARIKARRPSGGAVELLLLGTGPGPVEALARPARRLKYGERLTIADGVWATMVSRDPETVMVELSDDPLVVMARHGQIPLPPYLLRDADESDRERYQTVFAERPGSSAAPTAGLHFTPEILDEARRRGIGVETVTLHVGLGTFRPLRDEDVERGALHPETYEVPAKTALAIETARKSGGRVIAVGTTTVRALHSATPAGSRFPQASWGTTTLFLRPPDQIGAIDGMITNFHLPRSSLLMLVACVIGRERLLEAYRHAIDSHYRFYSYGDAMLLL